MSSEQIDLERIIAYIDGFNLYHGLCERGWRRYLWLDLRALVERLLKPHQEVRGIRYFTTRIDGPPDSQRRQTIYLDALAAHCGIRPVFGTFSYAPNQCRECDASWEEREEKQTDVAIAVHMLRDAYNNQFDAALLISGDSDQVPTVAEIEGEHDGKRVICAFPPKRKSNELEAVASSSFVIGRRAFHLSQLPAIVLGEAGYALCQPVEWWRAPEATEGSGEDGIGSS